MSESQALIGPVVVLNYSYRNLPVVAQRVHDGMNNNALFPNPSIPMTQLANDIAAYLASLSGNSKLSTATKKSLKRNLVLDLKHLRDDAQTVVERQTSRADALKVAESAGMTLKKPSGPRNKPELAVKFSGLSGIVELDAKAVAPSTTYYWQFSLDGRTWTSVPETMKHVTVISGLTPGQTYYFRFRALTRKGMRDWSQVVSLIVR
jgi:hypothetical protein